MPRVFNKKSKLPKKHLYHIILTNHGKQLRHLFYTDTEPKVYKEFVEGIRKGRLPDKVQQ